METSECLGTLVGGVTSGSRGILQLSKVRCPKFAHRTELSSWKLSSSSTFATAIPYAYKGVLVRVRLIILFKKISFWVLNFGGCDLYSGSSSIHSSQIIHCHVIGKKCILHYVTVCIVVKVVVAFIFVFDCCLQGIWGAQVKEAVENMIEDLLLSDKKSTPSSQLSGGMKRKLRLN